MDGKRWNQLTAAAVLLCVVGVLWTRISGAIIARCLALLGAVLFLAAIIGSGLWYAKHPLRCPVCGRDQQPRGRGFPGLGYNGTDTLTCKNCGVTLPLSAWMGDQCGDSRAQNRNDLKKEE